MKLIFVFTFTCLILIHQTTSSKILFSTILPSHRGLMMDLADLLRKHRHDVEFVSFQNDATDFTRRNFAVNVVKPDLNFTLSEFGFVNNPFDHLNELNRWCWHLFNDSKLFQSIGDGNYDVIVHDLTGNDVCLLAWAKKLGLSVIGFLPNGLTIPIANYLDIPWFTHLDNQETDMVDRIVTVFSNYFVMRKWNNLYYNPTEKIIAEFVKGDVNSYQLYQGLNLLLTNENSVLEHSNPGIINVIPIGGLQCDSPNPVSKAVDGFIKSFRQGVVYVLLPLLEDVLPEKIKMLDNIFQHFPLYAFVWERKENVTENMQNLLVVDSINRQDILGHPRTRLFISFCDSTDVYSTIFHGVPILCIPSISSEKNKMADLVTKQKIGLSLLTLNEDNFVQGIRKLLMDRSFYHKCRKLSTIFRDQPETPSDRFIFWVEYVIRHKGHHDIKEYYVKSSVQYYALDMAVIYLVFIIMFVIIVGIVLYFAIQVYRLPKSKGKVE